MKRIDFEHGTITGNILGSMNLRNMGHYMNVNLRK